ncbi:DnaJ-domain-containing protein [Coniochaeta sp. PMI_546]|nr:DnaJ-domain-containing protein [Coniochaeta sp. PMI_546]
MSNLPPDPWKVLGIEKSADKSEIRTAYRKLVLKCHPDKVQDPTLKAQKQDEFQKVQQAYELLNDDAERAKYEEQLKLSEMRKAAMLSKNMPNISASRTPPRSSHTFYEVRTAEPQSRFRHASPHQPSPVPPGGKVYTHVYASSKSYDDDVSPRSQTLYDEDRRARRAASYEQPSRREDEKREERKRREARDRKDEEERDRERERREKELRKQDRREREKVRDKEKRRDVEDKTSRRTAKEVYVEEYERDIREVYPSAAKAEKKKVSPSSGSKKLDDSREKSSSRRERDESPRTRTDKHDYLKEEAAAYIERQRAKSKPAPPSLGRSQTFQQPPTYARVPSPPPAPAEYIDDDDVRRSSARPSRRASNDAGVRSKERLYSGSQKKSREDFEVLDAQPRAERVAPPRSERIVPTLKKSNTMPAMAPPVVPESPPRHPLRHNTAQEVYARPPPSMPAMTRASTFAGEKVDRYPVIRGEYEPSDDEVYESRRRHRSRRTHSPEAATTTRRYKPNGVSVTPIETVYEPDVYDHYDDYRSSRRHGSSYGPKIVETGGRGGPEYYYDSPPAVPFGKVKIAKDFTPEDVAYSVRHPPSQGNWGGVVA